MPTRQNRTNLIQLSKSPRTPGARFAPEKNFFEIFSLGVFYVRRRRDAQHSRPLGTRGVFDLRLDKIAKTRKIYVAKTARGTKPLPSNKRDAETDGEKTAKKKRRPQNSARDKTFTVEQTRRGNRRRKNGKKEASPPKQRAGQNACRRTNATRETPKSANQKSLSPTKQNSDIKTSAKKARPQKNAKPKTRNKTLAVEQMRREEQKQPRAFFIGAAARFPPKSQKRRAFFRARLRKRLGMIRADRLIQTSRRVGLSSKAVGIASRSSLGLNGEARWDGKNAVVFDAQVPKNG